MVNAIPKIGAGTRDNLLGLSLEDLVTFALKAQELAAYDELTKLLLRRPFNEQVSKELRRLKEEKDTAGAVLMIDIDHFKEVNDSFGHEVGDRVIKHVARIMSENFRPGDIISRHGGEEFLVWLPSVGKQEVFLVAERVRTSVAERATDFTLPAITVSIGIALVGDHGHDLSFLSVVADKGLYIAKETGRNKTVVADMKIAENERRTRKDSRSTDRRRS
ncbi:MAG: GGDEF domain-containing protein [Candidatus Paceibacterota bacterium]